MQYDIIEVRHVMGFLLHYILGHDIKSVTNPTNPLTLIYTHINPKDQGLEWHLVIIRSETHLSVWGQNNRLSRRTFKRSTHKNGEVFSMGSLFFQIISPSVDKTGTDWVNMISTWTHYAHYRIFTFLSMLPLIMLKHTQYTTLSKIHTLEGNGETGTAEHDRKKTAL